MHWHPNAEESRQIAGGLIWVAFLIDAGPFGLDQDRWTAS